TGRTAGLDPGRVLGDLRRDAPAGDRRRPAALGGAGRPRHLDRLPAGGDARRAGPHVRHTPLTGGSAVRGAAVSGGLRVEHRGPALVLTLDRPERRNALTVALAGELAAAVAGAAATGARAVVLTGAPPAFCAGG